MSNFKRFISLSLTFVMMGILTGSLQAETLTPVSAEEALENKAFTDLEETFQDFKNSYKSFTGLCAKSDRYKMSQEKKTSIRHLTRQAIFKGVVSEYDYPLDIYINQGEKLNEQNVEVATRYSTGKWNLPSYHRRLGTTPQMRQALEKKDEILDKLIKISKSQSIYFSIGSHGNPFGKLYFLSLVDKESGELFLLQAGWCE